MTLTNHLLYVADYNNNRVMVFSTSSLANGENASYVLDSRATVPAAPRRRRRG